MPYRTLVGLLKKEPDQGDKKKLLIKKILSTSINDWKYLGIDTKINPFGEYIFRYSRSEIRISTDGSIYNSVLSAESFLFRARAIKKFAKGLHKAFLEKKKEDKISALLKEMDDAI